MKALKDILFRVSIDAVQGELDRPVVAIAFDSRKVVPQGMFVAQAGENFDGHRFIDQAIQAGATTVVCEVLPELMQADITYVRVGDSRLALGQMAANFYDAPSTKLQLVGVTGTNGKTTVTTLLYDIFTRLGYTTGLISTIRTMIGTVAQDSSHTTPDPLQLQESLKAMVDAGVTHCFMEVSSHGIAQKRIEGLTFAGGVFTNLSHDHLDFHKTFAQYRDVKKEFFDQLSEEAFVLVNADDKNAAYMLQNCSAKHIKYALKTQADYRVKILENQFEGMLLSFQQTEVWTQLVGTYNASNLLAVCAVAQELGVPAEVLFPQMSLLKNVEGRFEVLRLQNRVVIVDFAHTPDALKNVLQTINAIRTQNETLYTLIGCGGDRDAEKRPEMGKVAAQESNRVIFTSDNPRNESPENILKEMMAGVAPEDYKKTLSITSREEAIQAVSRMAAEGDVVLIAGKGHEKYQEINGERLPFDDSALAQKYFTEI